MSDDAFCYCFGVFFVGDVLDRLDSDVVAMDSDGRCTVVACRDGSLRLLASPSDGGFVQASACMPVVFCFSVACVIGRHSLGLLELLREATW